MSSTGHTCTPLHFSRIYNVVTQTCFAEPDKKIGVCEKTTTTLNAEAAIAVAAEVDKTTVEAFQKFNKKIGFKVVPKNIDRLRFFS